MDSVLHCAVRAELETFVGELRDNGRAPLPRYVVQALRGYLRCGDFAHGFSRYHCDRCDHDLLVAFSCGKRSICPSCGVRRMDEVGAELVDRIMPELPYRQWVLSVPWDLRALAARKADVLTALIRCLWRALRKELVTANGNRDAEPGAITFVQRFGGSLNLNVHLHVIVPDGVFVRDGAGVRFVPVTPDRSMVERVVGRTRKSMLRWLGKKGYLADEAGPEQEPGGLERCQQIALHYGELVGLPSAASKTGKSHFDTKRHGSRHARTLDGFDLEANVSIAHGDDEGRERVVRYCARPAIALEHLRRLPDGKYSYRTKYTRQGRTHRVMTGTELMARLCALVPPPRYPLLRYSGVFSAAHTLRSLVVPKPPEPSSRGCRPVATDRPLPSPTERPPQLDDQEPSTEHCELRSPFILTDAHLRRLLDGLLVMKSSRADWASLLKRSHGLDVTDCPSCHGRLRLLAVVNDKSEARRFLRHLGRPSEPPTISRARDPTLDAVA